LKVKRTALLGRALTYANLLAHEGKTAQEGEFTVHRVFLGGSRLVNERVPNPGVPTHAILESAAETYRIRADTPADRKLSNEEV
jgi:hypothetical protein